MRRDVQLERVAKVAQRLKKAGGSTPPTQVIARFAEERRHKPGLTAAKFYKMADEELDAIAGDAKPATDAIDSAPRDELLEMLLSVVADPDRLRQILEGLDDAQIRELTKNLGTLADDFELIDKAGAELEPSLATAGSTPEKFSEGLHATYVKHGRAAALKCLPPKYHWALRI